MATAATPYTLNVLDFGAVGDGSTDDSHAIQSTLNAAQAGYSTTVGSCTTTSGSSTVTTTSSFRGSNDNRIGPGMVVSGTGIPSGTTVLQVTSATQLILSANATANGTVTLTFSSPDGCTCFIPASPSGAGTSFFTTATITIPANVDLILQGILSIGNGIAMGTSTNLVVEGTIIMQTGVNAAMIYITAQTNVSVSGTGALIGNALGGLNSAGGIWVRGSTDVVIRDITITNTGSWPVNVDNDGTGVNSSNVLLDNVTMTSGGHSVQFTSGSTQCWARNCFISGITDYGFAFYNGISYCGISDSIVTNCTSSAIAVIGPAASTNVTISGNFIYGSQASGIVVTGQSGANHVAVLVTRNVLDGNMTTKAASTYADIGVDYTTSCTISDNLIGNSGNSGAASFAGVSVGQHANWVQVLNNKIRNEGVGTTTGIGVRVDSTSATSKNNIMVVGNQIFDNQGTKSVQYGIWGPNNSQQGVVLGCNVIGPVISSDISFTVSPSSNAFNNPSM